VVAGTMVLRDPVAIRRHIGLAGQPAATNETLSGQENL
jgi:ABC-2 type transport system ATP-binding protein